MTAIQGEVKNIKRTMVEEGDKRNTEARVVNEAVATVTVRVDALETAQVDTIQPVQELKARVEDMLGEVAFPVNRTIVAQNVKFEENEDLSNVAGDIIHNALELPNIVILRTQRKSGWEKGAGLIKIELETNEAVKEVLKHKRKLKKATGEYMQSIFLRQSKKEEVLVHERNEDLIMRNLGIRKNYIRLPSGHLAMKEKYPQSGVANGGSQGQGGGRRGRGSATGNQSRDRRTSSTQRGPLQGNVDSNDARTAQREHCARNNISTGSTDNTDMNASGGHGPSTA